MQCNAAQRAAPHPPTTPLDTPHATLQDKEQAIARLTRVADQGYVFAQELLRQWHA
jgi:hypothetical protein